MRLFSKFSESFYQRQFAKAKLDIFIGLVLIPGEQKFIQSDIRNGLQKELLLYCPKGLHWLVSLEFDNLIYLCLMIVICCIKPNICQFVKLKLLTFFNSFGHYYIFRSHLQYENI